MIRGDDASELEAYLKISSMKQIKLEEGTHCADQLERAIMLCEESLRVRLKIMDSQAMTNGQLIGVLHEIIKAITINEPD